MPLPPFVKSPVFLSGLGAAGSGVAGIGGWQIYDGAYPTADKQLAGRGLLLKPALPDLEADTSKGMHDKSGNENKYFLKTYGCFEKFFPGATVNHSTVSNDGQFSDPLSNGTWENKEKGEGVPIGCALMNLSYEGVSDANKNTKYIFKSEITVKNDKFGGALGAGAKDMKSSSTESNDTSQVGLDYYLVFLENKEGKGSWSIIGGYFWPDSGGAITSHNPEILQIFAPDKEENGASLIRKHKGNTEKKYTEYSGMWEASKDGHEIFQDIGIWYGERHASAEILGRDFKSGSEEIDFSQDPKIYAEKGYKNSNGGQLLQGCSSGSGKDVGSTLNKFYEPFKGKKGTGKRSEEYCKSRSYARGLNDSKLKELESLCYSAASTK